MRMKVGKMFKSLLLAAVVAVGGSLAVVETADASGGRYRSPGWSTYSARPFIGVPSPRYRVYSTPRYGVPYGSRYRVPSSSWNRGFPGYGYPGYRSGISIGIGSVRSPYGFGVPRGSGFFFGR